MYDILISRGTVIDGSGSPGFKADVAVKDGFIKNIGDLNDDCSPAKRTIDAEGLIVSPGFIDTHAHSDGALLINPQHSNGLRQGITTEILGQDGLSYAPLSHKNYLMYRQYLSGIYGLPPENIVTDNVHGFLGNYDHKTSINVAYPVPHGAIRLSTVGFHDKPLTGTFLDQAKTLVADSMEQGAIGLSTGLSYFPNSWSNTQELIELCKIVAQYEGVYITHLRDVLCERAFGEGMVSEALEIGRKSGVKIHFSHFRTGIENAGKVNELMEQIDSAKNEGVDCSLELYPYPTGSGFPLMFLPPEAHEGGPDQIMHILNHSIKRQRIADYIDEHHAWIANDGVVTFVQSQANIGILGKTFGDIAAGRQTSVGEAICSLLLEEKLAVGFLQAPPSSLGDWNQTSLDAVELLSRTDYMVGSDSISSHSRPHPRAYGTFPKLLGRLRRKFGIMSLEDMIHRFTANPAKRFQLSGRGMIKPGYAADIVIFDSEQIIDTATYEDPDQFPIGIPYVIVNGQMAVDSEKITGSLSGHALRRSPSNSTH